MKRYIAMLLSLVLCLGLCACGGEKVPEVLGEEVSGGMTGEHVAMITDAVKTYMETDNFKAMAEMAGYDGVADAMYYQAVGGAEDHNVQLLFVELAMDAETAGSARTLVIDLRDGTCYDEKALDMNNYMGEEATYEDVMKMAFGGYFSYLTFDDALCVMTEREVRTPATDAQIETINAALAG